MSTATKVVNGAGSVVKTFRLALPKLGVGWMFALLTINFNRIAINELGIAAVLVTGLLSIHYLLSPFQVITGRFADRHPILGYRRTPLLLVAAIIASIVFVLVPSTVHQMASGAPLAYAAGLTLFVVFGICIAIMGDSHHTLISEVVTPKARGSVISVVWTFTILSTIIASVIMNRVMPEYTPAGMQTLYNLTPIVVIGSMLLGIIGMEKRLKGEAMAAAIAKARAATPEGNPVDVTVKVLRQNPQARAFFVFVFVAILSIFLQDNILEVFGAEALNLSLRETTRFQQMWGGGVLIGMLLMGIGSVVFSITKRRITLIGCLGTAFGMAMLAITALTQTPSLVTPSLVIMGFFTGLFNVGALSMMMDMTIEGAAGLYMGMWGMAQAFGNGVASVGSGALHTALIESGLLSPNIAYFGIFGFEAAGMVLAAAIMWRLSVQSFQNQHASMLTRADAVRAMEAGAAA